MLCSHLETFALLDQTNDFAMKCLTALARVLSLCSLLLGVRGDDAFPLPDYKVHPLPIASTFVWFSSVELAVCYSPQARLAGVKGALHCNAQEDYDVDNNTWTLPQTCVALKPLGGPLSTAVRDACKNAKGTFNVIVPAASNAEGSQAYNAIQKQGGGSDAGSPGTNDPLEPSPDSTGKEDQDGKDGGGFLGLFGG